MNCSPLFSVIVPTYNRAGLIGETLDSFMKQSFDDFELIIVDDGSTDNTEEVVESWLRADIRIRYYKKPNGERGAARNFGVARAKGEYVTFIDSDDIAYPHGLEEAHAFMTVTGRPACFALRYEFRNREDMKEVMPPPRFGGPLANTALRKSNVLGCIGVFIRREIAASLPFEEDRRFAGTEDWLLWLKLGARHAIHYNSRISYCVLQHDDRSVMGFAEEKLRYRAEQLRALLQADPPSVQAYGPEGINAIYAHMLTYASLHLAMSKSPGRALHYLMKGIRISPAETFRKRTIGIFKTLLLSAVR